VKRGGVAQAQARHHAAARLNTEALHHFTHIDWLTLAYGRRSQIATPRPFISTANAKNIITAVRRGH
jgi:hypothetical protein